MNNFILVLSYISITGHADAQVWQGYASEKICQKAEVDYTQILISQGNRDVTAYCIKALKDN